MTFQVIYASKANEIYQDELERILDQARQNNVANDITGVLVFVDNIFLQVLEGEQQKVLALLDAIKNDKRHTDVKLIGQAKVEKRSFEDWAMAYVDLKKEDMVDWFKLEGTKSMEQIIGIVEAEAEAFPSYLKNLLNTIAAND